MYAYMLEKIRKYPNESYKIKLNRWIKVNPELNSKIKFNLNSSTYSFLLFSQSKLFILLLIDC